MIEDLIESSIAVIIEVVILIAFVEVVIQIVY